MVVQLYMVSKAGHVRKVDKNQHGLCGTLTWARISEKIITLKTVPYIKPN